MHDVCPGSLCWFFLLLLNSSYLLKQYFRNMEGILPIFLLCAVLLLLDTASAFPKYQEDAKMEVLTREKRQSRGKANKRQAGGSLGVNSAANCDFNKGPGVETCLWDNLANYTALQWGASKGEDAYWIGGPRMDKNDGSLD